MPCARDDYATVAGSRKKLRNAMRNRPKQGVPEGSLRPTQDDHATVEGSRNDLRNATRKQYMIATQGDYATVAEKGDHEVVDEVYEGTKRSRSLCVDEAHKESPTRSV